ncbi:MAG: HdeD family acid-resistance protein [Reyranella sp.]|uniref:HdeD family acid-resistance protein n=1 Tax=Reyranella sp. TaxID=1929291 RepID=UPI00273154AC|nr:HdeD family acid-resistance protein [Reyranella sp.]MDP1962450.1 HdeD family acid-resistance protein [Reyranella sp.]MDP2374810.1 HdeD family acid-resistance protein [Reyranella sp.]
MSMTADKSGPHSLADGLKTLRAKWGWIVALGVVFMIAGVIALGSIVTATETAVLVVGIMMLMGGVAEIIAAFGVKSWGKFLFWLLLGVLYVAAGVIAIMNPLLAAVYLTLMLGVALAVGGILRIFLAFSMKSGGGPWAWVALSGVITFALGCMIIAQWPASSLFVLGIFLGIDLIFIGAGWITMGLALKKRAA